LYGGLYEGLHIIRYFPWRVSKVQAEQALAALVLRCNSNRPMRTTAMLEEVIYTTPPLFVL
jgi:hypothetical protein